MDIGSNIKKLRLECNMSQEDLASALGYKSRSSIAKIESGGNNLPQSKIVDIAAIFDTTPDVVMGWSKEAQSKGMKLDYSDYTLIHEYCNEKFMGYADIAEEIIFYLEYLSVEGLEKVYERIQELILIPKYSKQKNSTSSDTNNEHE